MPGYAAKVVGETIRWRLDPTLLHEQGHLAAVTTSVLRHVEQNVRTAECLLLPISERHLQDLTEISLVELARVVDVPLVDRADGLLQLGERRGFRWIW